jgi:hypothetical protein
MNSHLNVGATNIAGQSSTAGTTTANAATSQSFKPVQMDSSVLASTNYQAGFPFDLSLLKGLTNVGQTYTFTATLTVTWTGVTGTKRTSNVQSSYVYGASSISIHDDTIGSSSGFVAGASVGLLAAAALLA